MIRYNKKQYTWPEWDEMDELPDDKELLLSDARGIYIPRDFTEECFFAIPKRLRKYCNRNILRNPDHSWYWEQWHDVLSNCILVSKKTGQVYGLYQDGDLWAIPLVEVKAGE
jgi:hypothetical protein